jgi:hypothetical protein
MTCPRWFTGGRPSSRLALTDQIERFERSWLDRGYTDEDPPKFHDTDQPAYQSIVAVGYNGATNAPHLPERMVPKRASNKTSIEIKNIKVSNSAYFLA